MRRDSSAGPAADERTRPAGRRAAEPPRLVRQSGAELAEVVNRAVLHVQAEWPMVESSEQMAEDVMLHAGVVGAAIRQALAGQEPDLAEVTRPPLARRLVEQVRSRTVEYLARQPEPPDPAALLALFAAMDRVMLALSPEWDQVFADRLAGPNGLELVVEVAHDIRSPLTSILFLAETIQRGRSGPLTDIQERQVGLIYSAAFGLSAMASDVIELARGGDRLIDLDPIPFSVTDILESVKDIILPIAEEKGLAVRLQPPESDFRVGHPVALSRVLLNLTTNSLKFTDEGYVEVVARQTTRTGIEFSVRDTGRGIPENAMRTLFEPFRRRQKEGEYRFSGAGLGLSICRKLVETMGSELRVETAPNAGTRFFFELDLPLASQL